MSYPSAISAFSFLASTEGLSLSIELALLFLLYLTLPKSSLGLMRVPMALLASHLIFYGLKRFLRPEGLLNYVIEFFVLLSLLSAIGRSLVLIILDVALDKKFHKPVPKIMRDLAQATIYLGILFLCLRIVGVDARNLFTTSALLTAVVGLSLQDTLGNLFSGLAIQLQKPFEIGDWIQLDDNAKHAGRVIEMNWRSTRLITLDRVELIVPNSMAAKAAMLNFTKPTRTSRRSLFVFAPTNVPPHEVQRTIVEALDASYGVLSEPPASVLTNRFVPENGIEYWVRFFTDKFDERDKVDGEARDRIWYAFRRMGIEFPPSQRSVLLQHVTEETKRKDEEAKIARRVRAMKNVDLLNVLKPEELRNLAQGARLRMYVAGEIILHEGEISKELYIVDRGHLRVYRGTIEAHMPSPGLKRNLAARDKAGVQKSEHGNEGGGEAKLVNVKHSDSGHLGQGDFFGEWGLVTGEPRLATVQAETDCELIAIGHEAFKEMLANVPAAALHISKLLAERPREFISDENVENISQRVDEERERILDRIKRFFT